MSNEPPRLLHEVLRDQAERAPDRRLYRFLSSGDARGPQVCCSRAELNHRAQAVAAHLAEDRPPGSVALLIYTPGQEFIAAFFGCLYAGIIAVPVYPPDPFNLTRSLPVLRAIAHDAGADIVLCTASVLPIARQLGQHAPELATLSWIATDTLQPAFDAGWQRRSIQPHDVACLQYTSGSTGSPKGVMLTHANLLANLQSIHDIAATPPSSVTCSWLPMYHDMGLIGGVLYPLFCGGEATLMSPIAFLQRPMRWLQAISAFRAYASPAPNFAYDLCVRKATPADLDGLDLSAWKVAPIAAEPVRPRTLERFARTFGPHGFSAETFCPCFGLAESTLIVTARPHRTLPIIRSFDTAALSNRRAVASTTNARELTGCGTPVGDTAVAIVDPDRHTRCKEKVVGEIWLHGSSIARGYWRNPEDTQAIFRGRIADDTDTRAWLRTGDLGFCLEGELFVVSRIKGLIIIRGRNLYPQDLEHAAERAHPAIRRSCTAAFSVMIHGEEHVGLLAEVDVSKTSDTAAEVLVAVAEGVTAECGERPSVLALLAPRSLPKTTSGKIRRRACRQAWNEGKLRPLAKLPPPAEVVPAERAQDETTTAWLVRWLECRRGLPVARRDLRRPFFTLGISSLDLVELSADLGDRIGMPVRTSVLFDHPSPAALVKWIEGNVREDAPVQATDGREPIAVLGIGCRLAQGTRGPAALWERLLRGDELITDVPNDRWSTERGLGRLGPTRGGFLSNPWEYDAEFFGMSPREAEVLDPQQRILLEVTWEALEHAGIRPSTLEDSRTGVFVGCSPSDYALRTLGTEVPERVDFHAAIGSAPSAAAGRVSYLLGLRGPALSVDTACSSSLVAVHLAMQSLRAGEIDLALVGGVHIMTSSTTGVALTRAGMLSPDGRCHTYDRSAAGYVRSEGCGVLVLGRLDDARRGRHHVAAVLLGSAVNQDGASNGFTAPSRRAQQELVRRAVSQAGITPTDISYVEGHGSSTPLGDPIELEALHDALCVGRDAGNPLLVGSVKTNLGHLEAAAGIIGLIKAVLAVERGTIPPHLHLRTPTPAVPWESWPMEIPTRAVPWPKKDHLTGVSSFGFTGTNAHVVLDRAPVAPIPHVVDTPGPSALILSARTKNALRRHARQVATYLKGQSDEQLPRIAFTSQALRDRQDACLAVVGEHTGELSSALSAFASGTHEAVTAYSSSKGRSTRLGFLFPGQGSQRAGVGRTLYAQESTFREVIDTCDATLGSRGGARLRDVLFPDDTHHAHLIQQVRWSQVAIYAQSCAIAEMLGSWGVHPDVVVGHSAGEYAAARSAGVFDLLDGLRLIDRRARLMADLQPRGAMAAVSLPAASVRRILGALGGEVVIAAYNAPEQVVISGVIPALEEAERRFRQLGAHVHRLDVAQGFHSPIVEPMLDGLAAAFGSVRLGAPHSPLISNLTGEWVGEGIEHPQYWTTHTREAVCFGECAKTLWRSGVDVLVQVGPGRSLIALAACAPNAPSEFVQITTLPTHSEPRPLVELLATLDVAGVSVDWTSGARRHYVVADLPTTPLDGRNHQVQRIPNAATRDRHHPILGYRLPGLAHRPETVAWTRAVPSGASTDWLRTLCEAAAREALGPGVDMTALETHGRVPAPHVNIQVAVEPIEPTKWALRVRAALPHGIWEDIADGEAVQGEVVHRVDWVQVCDDPIGHQDRFVLMGGPPELRVSLSRDLRAQGASVDSDPVGNFGPVGSHAGAMWVFLHCGEQARPRPVDPEVLQDIVDLVEQARRHGAQVCLVTHGAQRVSSVGGHELGGALWGLGRCLSLERPEVFRGMVDLDPRTTLEEQSTGLATHLIRPGIEAQLARRDAHWSAPRLISHRLPPAPARVLDPARPWMVVGGLGGVGQMITAWLVSHGVRDLMLVGPRGLGTGRTHTLRAHFVTWLQRQGASVRVVAADASSLEEMAQCFEDLGPALGGVVHAAGVVHREPLEALTPEAFRRVLVPKVEVARVLDALTRDLPLEAFIVCSSAAGVWGSTELCHYGAANGAVDGLLWARQAEGRVATTVRWGLLEDGGTTTAAATKALARFGLMPLARRPAMHALERVLAANETAPVVASVDWPMFKKVYETRPGRRLLAAMTEAEITSLGGPDHEGVSAPVEQIEQTLRRVLRLPPSQVIDPDQDLATLGLDSILAVEFTHELERVMGTTIPVSRLLDRPTTLGDIEALVAQTPATSVTTIPRHRGGGDVPISDGQARLLVETLRYPAVNLYAVQVQIPFRQAPDIDALRSSIRRIVDRHPILRSALPTVEGRRVLRQVAIPELGEVQGSRADAITFARQQAAAPFDFEKGPLMRIALCRTGTEAWVLLTIHHVLVDGWSVHQLYAELVLEYTSALAGERATVPTPARSFDEVAHWMSLGRADGRWQDGLSWWRDELAAVPALALPIDRDRPRDGRGDLIHMRLPPALTCALEQLAQRASVSTFSVLFAVWAALLGRLTHQDDLPLPMVMSRRRRSELARTVGLLSNTVVLRCRLGSESSFLDLLGEVSRRLRGARTHEEIPFDLVVDTLRRGGTPLGPLRTLFNLQPLDWNLSEGPLGAPIMAAPDAAVSDTARFDFSVALAPFEEGYDIAFEYATARIETETAQRWAEMFVLICRAVVHTPELLLHDLPVISARDAVRMKRWNHTGHAPSLASGLLAQIRRHVDDRPDAIAVHTLTGDLTYRALWQQAEAAAERVQASASPDSELVGALLAPSPEALAAVMGCWMAGRGLVPLDPRFPPHRLQQMIDDSGVGTILTTADTLRDAESALTSAPPFVRVDDLTTRTTIPPPSRDPVETAYVMYTSGSTGHPKGVRIPHRALANLVSALGRRVGTTPGARWSWLTTLSFDIAMAEMFVPLTTGGVVVPVPDELRQDGIRLVRFFEKHHLDYIQATPTTWRLLCRAGWAGDDKLNVLCGGEALDLDLARTLHSRCARLWNVYGPTETTVWSTAGEIIEDTHEITIGTALDNTTLHIVDPTRRHQLIRVPIGVPGELCIGGAGLATEYHGLPQQTVTAFPTGTFDHGPERVYRTRDKVRRRSDGSISYLGRLDRQVKLRGHRFELEEVETVLTNHPAVSLAAAKLWDDPKGPRRLVAYLVTTEAASPPARADLRTHMLARLPEHMVPSVFILLDEVPLTPNGKLDHKVLPAPETTTIRTDDSHITPRNPIETALAKTFEDALGLPPGSVGVHDDLFSLGGDSLRSLSLITLAAQRELHLVLRDLLTPKTVAQLAEGLRDSGARGMPPAPPTLPSSECVVAPSAPPARRRNDSPCEVSWELPDGPLKGLHWGAPEAPEVLCIHGNREQALMWARVAEHLVAAGYQVIAPDLRGHGCSPHLPGAGGYPLSVLFRDVAALVRLMESPPILVGHSLGGILSQVVARASPQSLRGLVLVESPLVEQTPKPSRPNLEALLWPKTPAHPTFNQPSEAAEWLRRTCPVLSQDFADALASRVLQAEEEKWTWRWDPRLLLAYETMPFSEHGTSFLKDLQTAELPITAIIGTRSTMTQSEDRAHLRAIGGVVHEVDAAHHPHISHPAEVADMVVRQGRDLLREHSTR